MGLLDAPSHCTDFRLPNSEGKTCVRDVAAEGVKDFEAGGVDGIKTTK